MPEEPVISNPVLDYGFEGQALTALIQDPTLVQELILERQRTGADRYDEVWDGVYVVAALANNEHQQLVFRFAYVLQMAMGEESAAKIFPGVNVSDREADWKVNYRCPDVAVVLPGNTAKDCDTHLCGGPDFLVEIVSPYDRSRQKLDFYARIGVRELLVLDRNPWSLELYRLVADRMELVGTSTPAEPKQVVSEVLPVAFSLLGNPAGRPTVEVTERASSAEASRRWTI